MDSKEKNAFRRKKEWKEFSKEFLKENPKCCFCGNLKTKKVVHHKFVENYDLLKEERFLVLCASCHRMCHLFARKKSLSEHIVDLKKIIKNIDFGDDWIK